MRIAFWQLAAQVYGRGSSPRKVSLKGTMPAFTNSSVGSFAGTSDAEGTTVCPRRAKKSRNDCLSFALSIEAASPIVCRKPLYEAHRAVSTGAEVLHKWAGGCVKIIHACGALRDLYNAEDRAIPKSVSGPGVDAFAGPQGAETGESLDFRRR